MVSIIYLLLEAPRLMLWEASCLDFVMLAIRHKRSSHEGPALDSNRNPAITGADSRGVLGQTMVKKFWKSAIPAFSRLKTPKRSQPNSD